MIRVVPTVFASTKTSPGLLSRRLTSGVFLETDLGLEKRCSKCREYWPADNTAFYVCSKAPDGLYDWCKACYLEWKKGWVVRGDSIVDVRQMRKKLGMQQKEFWSRVGVSQSGGSRYESGRAIPLPVRLLLLFAYGTRKQWEETARRLRPARWWGESPE